MKNHRLVEAYLNNNAPPGLGRSFDCHEVPWRKKQESAFWNYGMTGLPPPELTYPTLGSSENHQLKMPFFGGYVNFQEGTLPET